MPHRDAMYFPFMWDYMFRGPKIDFLAEVAADTEVDEEFRKRVLAYLKSLECRRKAAIELDDES
jgi:hypothetical protein